METIVIDKVIFTAFGSLIVILLALISYFLKASHGDLKSMLQDHEERIKDVEKHKERTEVHHVNNQAIVNEIKTKLDLIYELHRGQ
jgi:hypothetical protein